MDENLTFTNADFIEDFIEETLSRHSTEHIVLIFTSVSYIDSTALEKLELINHSLKARNICLHFAEVKGPVMDKLKQTQLIKNLTGQLFFQISEAVKTLAKD